MYTLASLIYILYYSCWLSIDCVTSYHVEVFKNVSHIYYIYTYITIIYTCPKFINSYYMFSITQICFFSVSKFLINFD